MLNTEDGCIRYLMKEMDPSEEIEFERKMIRDENLLIEVESLRNTYQKLGKLPLKTPPEHIQREVAGLASQLQKQKLQNSKVWMSGVIRYVAAAAVLLMIFSTGFYFFGDSFFPNETGSESVVTPAANTVQPWVDRNEILQFAGTSEEPSMSSEIQTDITQSFSRLKLVNEQSGFNQPIKKIVLTSSSN